MSRKSTFRIKPCVICNQPFNRRPNLGNADWEKIKTCGQSCKKIYRTIPLKERFGRYFSIGGIDDCWHWYGILDKNGYGRLTIEGLNRLAHRISYEIHIAAIPRGMAVCHKCDTPPCVNQNHLWLGTQAQNMRDKKNKGRGRNQFSADRVTAERVK